MRRVRAQSAAHWAGGWVGASLKQFLSPAFFLPVPSTRPDWGPPCQAPGACQQASGRRLPPTPTPFTALPSAHRSDGGPLPALALDLRP